MRINRYIKIRNVKSKVVSLPQLYVHASVHNETVQDKRV